LISRLIDKSKSSDLLFLSGIIINYMNVEKRIGKETYSILPELFSTMGIENTINLIKYFGGEKIEIPSHEEMYQSFLVIICYYKKKIEGKDWNQIREELAIDISPHTLGKIIEKIDNDISLQVEDLKEYGIEEYISTLRKKVKGESK